MAGRRKIYGEMADIGDPREDFDLEPLLPVAFTPGTRCDELHGDIPAYSRCYCPVCHRTGKESEAEVQRLKVVPPSEPTDPDVLRQYPRPGEVSRDDRGVPKRSPKAERGVTDRHPADPEDHCPICSIKLRRRSKALLWDDEAPHRGIPSDALIRIMNSPEARKSLPPVGKWSTHRCASKRIKAIDRERGERVVRMHSPPGSPDYTPAGKVVDGPFGAEYMARPLDLTGRSPEFLAFAERLPEASQ